MQLAHPELIASVPDEVQEQLAVPEKQQPSSLRQQQQSDSSESEEQEQQPWHQPQQPQQQKQHQSTREELINEDVVRLHVRGECVYAPRVAPVIIYLGKSESSDPQEGQTDSSSMHNEPSSHRNDSPPSMPLARSKLLSTRETKSEDFQHVGSSGMNSWRHKEAAGEKLLNKQIERSFSFPVMSHPEQHLELLLRDLPTSAGTPVANEDGCETRQATFPCLPTGPAKSMPSLPQVDEVIIPVEVDDDDGSTSRQEQERLLLRRHRCDSEPTRTSGRGFDGVLHDTRRRRSLTSEAGSRHDRDISGAGSGSSSEGSDTLYITGLVSPYSSSEAVSRSNSNSPKGSSENVRRHTTPLLSVPHALRMPPHRRGSSLSEPTLSAVPEACVPVLPARGHLDRTGSSTSSSSSSSSQGAVGVDPSPAALAAVDAPTASAGQSQALQYSVVQDALQGLSDLSISQSSIAAGRQAAPTSPSCQQQGAGEGRGRSASLSVELMTPKTPSLESLREEQLHSKERCRSASVAVTLPAPHAPSAEKSENEQQIEAILAVQGKRMRACSTVGPSTPKPTSIQLQDQQNQQQNSQQQQQQQQQPTIPGGIQSARLSADLSTPITPAVEKQNRQQQSPPQPAIELRGRSASSSASLVTPMSASTKDQQQSDLSSHQRGERRGRSASMPAMPAIAHASSTPEPSANTQQQDEQQDEQQYEEQPSSEERSTSESLSSVPTTRETQSAETKPEEHQRMQQPAVEGQRRSASLSVAPMPSAAPAANTQQAEQKILRSPVRDERYRSKSLSVAVATPTATADQSAGTEKAEQDSSASPRQRSRSVDIVKVKATQLQFGPPPEVVTLSREGMETEDDVPLVAREEDKQRSQSSSARLQTASDAEVIHLPGLSTEPPVSVNIHLAAAKAPGLLELAVPCTTKLGAEVELSFTSPTLTTTPVTRPTTVASRRTQPSVTRPQPLFPPITSYPPEPFNAWTIRIDHNYSWSGIQDPPGKPKKDLMPSLPLEGGRPVKGAIKLTPEQYPGKIGPLAGPPEPPPLPEAFSSTKGTSPMSQRPSSQRAMVASSVSPQSSSQIAMAASSSSLQSSSQPAMAASSSSPQPPSQPARVVSSASPRSSSQPAMSASSSSPAQTLSQGVPVAAAASVLSSPPQQPDSPSFELQRDELRMHVTPDSLAKLLGQPAGRKKQGQQEDEQKERGPGWQETDL
eukprot:scpid70141/ scgid28747/ 